MKPDWKLLREQKLCILGLSESARTTEHEAELLMGLVNMIDWIQDDAVADGEATELEVFGGTVEQDPEDTSCPTCGEDGGTSCGAVNCGLLT